MIEPGSEAGLTFSDRILSSSEDTSGTTGLSKTIHLTLVNAAVLDPPQTAVIVLHAEIYPQMERSSRHQQCGYRFRNGGG